ncbi:cellulase family glycosylhydrolase [Rhodococcus sp. MEB041]|uniref:cellulase family glycosylhydrolase n=1 Tax=Rhodococcus sp. MEB041 TaxID=3040323 RepID=UPI002551701D|nr:cellulase family glycosylhydrolase [Rhodococcus sp. MEB041]
MQVGRRVAQILLVVATVIATLSVPTASAASPYVGRQGIGLNGIDFRSSSSAQQAQATRVAGTGAKWVRIEIDWWYVQDGGPTAYNWSGPDGAVAAAKAKSLNVLLLIQKTPPWARTTNDGSTPPTNPNDYATFAAKVVSRYAPQGVRSFEVWNEPNLWMFWADPVTGKPNVQGYVDLLKAAYPKMKAATTSAISIVAAGLSPYGTTGQSPEGHAVSPITYLDQMYDLGAGPYFDAVGWHPYTAPALPNDTADWNAWSQMSVDFTNPDGTIYQMSARTIMTENGDAGKLIVMTEAGAATAGDPSVSEQVQATAYRQAVDNRLSYSWAGPIFFYETTDRAAMTAVNPDKENYFGVYRSNGVAKPAVTVLKSVR